MPRHPELEGIAQLIAMASTSTLDAAFGKYEQRILRHYFLNLLAVRVQNGRVRFTEEMLRWYASNESALRIPIPSLSKAVRDMDKGRNEASVSVSMTRAEIHRSRMTLPTPSSLQKRIDWVAHTLRLQPRDSACLAALCRLTQLQPFRSLAAANMQFNEERDEASAHLVLELVGETGRAIRKVFSRRSALTQLGMIEDRSGDDYAPTETLLRLLRQRTTDARVLEDILIGETFRSELELSDFDHMRQVRDDVTSILQGCLERKTKGACLLFYGPPGTGKTEFAALLGKACNARVVFAGEMDPDSQEPRRADRIAHLSLISAIGQRAGRVIVVVDEADDIFTGVDDDRLSGRTGSKVFMNRMIESSSIPTIWITNHPHRMGDAVIRRMLRAVEFREPGPDVRERIVARHAESLGLGLDGDERNRLAQLPAAPAVLASAVRAAWLGKGNGEMALAAAQSLHKAMGNHTPPAYSQPIAFDTSLCAADIDLALLEQSIARAGPGPVSFLFTGLPGTGKSAFARHLARRLGLEVLEKRASDLLGMFVGQSERNIADAFQDAVDGRCFLIFDEADSLLADRSNATRSWEVSQVNEMLTWMERHPLPFAATTNLSERLDPATLRRFTFKARFGAMTPEQIATAFHHHFGVEAPPPVLALEPLTNGDFVVVARQAAVTGMRQAEDLARMLELEVSMKPNAAKRIGFHSNLP